MLRVRGWCCALHTFVRVSSLLLICTHVTLALSVGLWNALMARADSSNARLFTIAGVLVVAFNSIGVICNLLVLIGIHVNRRALLLPWLVFQALIILGLFSVSLVLLVYFMLLVDEESRSSGDQALAVVALFPMVGGIFLIFVWVLFDQLFIQMRAMKTLGLRSVSASNLATLRANLEAPKEEKRVVRSESMHFNSSEHTSSPNSQLNRLKRAKSLEHMLVDSSSSSSSSGNTSRRDKISSRLGPHVWVSQSATPRRPSDVKRGHHHRRHAPRQLEEDSNTPSVGRRFKSPRRDRRNRRDHNQDQRLVDQRVVVVPTFSTATQDKHRVVPSYCTIDRSRLRRRTLSTTFDNDDELEDFSNVALATLPRKPPRRALNAARVHKVRSVDRALNHDFHNMDHVDKHNYFEDNKLRRTTSEHWSCGDPLHRTKSVTIHPDVVTELRYRECDSPDPPPFPPWSSSPSPPPPPSPSPPPPPPDVLWPPSPTTTTTTDTSGSPLPFSTTTGLTRDEIIHFYCRQEGDVPL